MAACEAADTYPLLPVAIYSKLTLRKPVPGAGLATLPLGLVFLMIKGLLGGDTRGTTTRVSFGSCSLRPS
eukprot:5433528-Prorocentrum_lima.AAC.1